MSRPILYATPLSHFARKIRILLTELEVPFELKFVPDLLSKDPADFGGNPILRIPTLRDGERWVIESDQIARYAVERWDPEDRLCVLSLEPEQRNVLSILNALMGAEVELILSARSGMEGVHEIPFFQRYLAVMEHCLAWLENEGRRSWTANEFSYLDVTLIAAWEHASHYQLVPIGDRFPWLAERAGRLAARPSVAPSTPARVGS